MFDMEKNIFTQERSDRKLIHPFRDRQGNRDYSKSNKIFCQLSDNKVKVFHRNTFFWDNLNIYLMKVHKNAKMGVSMPSTKGMKGLGCFGKRDEGVPEPAPVQPNQ